MYDSTHKFLNIIYKKKIKVSERIAEILHSVQKPQWISKRKQQSVKSFTQQQWLWQLDVKITVSLHPSAPRITQLPGPQAHHQVTLVKQWNSFCTGGLCKSQEDIRTRSCPVCQVGFCFREIQTDSKYIIPLLPRHNRQYKFSTQAIRLLALFRIHRQNQGPFFIPLKLVCSLILSLPTDTV